MNLPQVLPPDESLRQPGGDLAPGLPSPLMPASPAPRADRMDRILGQLELGFRTDSKRLIESEQDLSAAFREACLLGQQHGPPRNWYGNWESHWTVVESILRRVRGHLIELDAIMDGDDVDRLPKLAALWNQMQAEDANFDAALKTLQAQATWLQAGARPEWDRLSERIEAHIRAVRARAQALRLKARLLKTHSKAEVDRLLAELVLKQADRSPGGDAGISELDGAYRQAAEELQEEHHHFLGFWDIVKGLFMWVESPEERVRKNQGPEIGAPL